MPNKNYLKGRRFEYEVMKDFTKHGYEPMRTAGSHGKFDIVAINPTTGCIALVQCKAVEEEATAQRLLDKFRKSPPFPPMRLPQGVHQWMTVKVKGTKQYWSATV